MTAQFYLALLPARPGRRPAPPPLPADLGNTIETEAPTLHWGIRRADLDELLEAVGAAPESCAMSDAPVADRIAAVADEAIDDRDVGDERDVGIDDGDWQRAVRPRAGLTLALCTLLLATLAGLAAAGATVLVGGGGEEPGGSLVVAPARPAPAGDLGLPRAPAISIRSALHPSFVEGLEQDPPAGVAPDRVKPRRQAAKRRRVRRRARVDVDGILASAVTGDLSGTHAILSAGSRR